MCMPVSRLMGQLCDWIHNLLIIMGLWVSYNGKFLRIKIKAYKDC